MANLQVLAEKRAAQQPGSAELLDARDSSHSSGLFELFAKEVDDTLTWEAIPWLRTITKLPIYIKVLGARERTLLLCTLRALFMCRVCWTDWPRISACASTRWLPPCVLSRPCR
jgi:hypothetical protein